ARFLSTVEAEEVAHGYLLPQRHGAHGGLSAAREGRGDADQGRKQRDLGRFAIAVVEADDVASGNVTELVGEHALHFIGAVGGVYQAGMDVYPLSACHERVDRG